jgi:hypothetical protein
MTGKNGKVGKRGTRIGQSCQTLAAMVANMTMSGQEASPRLQHQTERVLAPHLPSCRLLGQAKHWPNLSSEGDQARSADQEGILLHSCAELGDSAPLTYVKARQCSLAHTSSGLQVYAQSPPMVLMEQGKIFRHKRHKKVPRGVLTLVEFWRMSCWCCTRSAMMLLMFSCQHTTPPIRVRVDRRVSHKLSEAIGCPVVRLSPGYTSKSRHAGMIGHTDDRPKRRCP